MRTLILIIGALSLLSSLSMAYPSAKSNMATNGLGGESPDPIFADGFEEIDPLAQGLISEFSAFMLDGPLGEFVEVHNPGSAGDLAGGTLTNKLGQPAIIRAAADPTGTLSLPVAIPIGGFAFGVPNPADPADIPAGAAFVYGAPGSAFSLADDGDELTLANRAGLILDELNFTDFRTTANTLMLPGEFPGSALVSTQLDNISLSTTANDSGNAWCTSFRVQQTAGAPNQSCAATLVVINELVYDGAVGEDTADPRKTYIELAGPGGASIATLRVRFIEVDGATAGQLDGPNVLIGVHFPGARIRADGLFVIADNTGGGFSQVVPQSEVDILTAFDPENSSQAAQLLLDVDGQLTLVDALAYVASAAELDVTVDAVNGLAVVEGTAAIDVNQGIALARNSSSDDSNDNLADFYPDITPSPGTQNDPL